MSGRCGPAWVVAASACVAAAPPAAGQDAWRCVHPLLPDPAEALTRGGGEPARPWLTVGEFTALTTAAMEAAGAYDSAVQGLIQYTRGSIGSRIGPDGAMESGEPIWLVTRPDDPFLLPGHAARHSGAPPGDVLRVRVDELLGEPDEGGGIRYRLPRPPEHAAPAFDGASGSEDLEGFPGTIRRAKPGVLPGGREAGRGS